MLMISINNTKIYNDANYNNTIYDNSDYDNLNNIIFIHILNITLIFDIFVLSSIMIKSSTFFYIENIISCCISGYIMYLIDEEKEIEYILIISLAMFIRTIYNFFHMLYKEYNKN